MSSCIEKFFGVGPVLGPSPGDADLADPTWRQGQGMDRDQPGGGREHERHQLQM